MLCINLKKEEKRSYSKQIYSVIREKILKGELEEGLALPSTREMSAELAISRNTVLTAYDMLASEGFVRGVPGSGIYVSHGLQAKGRGLQAGRPPLEIFDLRTATLADDSLSRDLISFDSGIPALDLFPRSKWNTFMARAFREAPVSALGYDDPQGRPELRSMLAGYLKRSRDIDCSPDQILVTTGAKQALTLIAKCLLDAGSEVLIEDPSNRNVKQIFSYHTDNIVPVAVDREGIAVNQLPKGGKPALLFTTPSRQFPMGGLLTIQRRLELVHYARETGCWLVEDDYDSEFRYDGAPASSLFELAPELVIYIGTFSKVMYPSLRLGYLVLPRQLTDLFREWKRLGDHHSNSISQLALMRFIESGELDRHIRRMKKLYRSRRELLLELLPRYFSGGFTVHGESAGMHIVLELPGVSFTPDLTKRIRDAGVYAVSVEEHAVVKGLHSGQIILGYAHLTRQEMELGLGIIRDTLHTLPSR